MGFFIAAHNNQFDFEGSVKHTRLYDRDHFSDIKIHKDDSDYLAFKETTWSYSKFVYHSTFLCEPVPPRSQSIEICCTMMTNMQTELRYVHL